MPFLLLLPTLFQTLLGLMAFADKLQGASGAAKKDLVLAGVQAALPAVALLPASTQQNIKDEAPKLAQSAALVSDMIDALHGVAKEHNLYPQIEQSLGVAADVAGGLRAAAEVLAPPVGD